MNKIRHFFVLCLLLGPASYAQIEAIPGTAGGGNCTISGTTCTFPASATMDIAVGDTVIVVHSANNQGSNPTLAGCGQTWPAPVKNQGNNHTLTVWVLVHAAVAATACNITASGFSGGNSFAVQVYRNVVSAGTVAMSPQTAGAVSMATPAVTAGSVGNFIVGLFGTVNANSLPMTAVGNTIFRRGGGNTTQAASVGIADLTATSVGQQVTVAVTPNTTVTYKSATVELTSPALPPTHRVALPTDAMQTVLMNTPQGMNYQLPATGLSTTWCTWFMPIGPSSNTYELEPASHVNGQTNPVHIPSWQMTRICQDAHGDFWASPPLLAGAGISIAPSPQGLTISAAGTPGSSGMTYINGGIAHLPGTVQVDPNSCTTLYTTAPATGVQQTDVVSYSLQPTTTGWGNGKLFFHAIAYDGSISWRACNSGDTAYTPTARDVNWYVARATP